MLYSGGSIQTKLTSRSNFFSIVKTYTITTHPLRDCIVINLEFVDNYQEQTIISNEDILLHSLNSHDLIQEFICHQSHRYREIIGEEENHRPRRTNREPVLDFSYSPLSSLALSEYDFERMRVMMEERALQFSSSGPLRTIPLFEEVLGVRSSNMSPMCDYKAINKTREKCFDAKTGLIFCNERYDNRLASLKDNYNGCMECAWYSLVFYIKDDPLHFHIIESDEDFERVKNNFVVHFNESHKDVVAQKLALKNPEMYT